MTIQEIKIAVGALSPQEKIQLMREIAPSLCKNFMENPHRMEKITPLCCGMMEERPGMMTQMRNMMKICFSNDSLPL